MIRELGKAICFAMAFPPRGPIISFPEKTQSQLKYRNNGDDPVRKSTNAKKTNSQKNLNRSRGAVTNLEENG